MKRFAALPAALLLLASPSPAQSLPELFQKAKAQVRGESWTEALRTLDALEVQAASPGNEVAREQLVAPMVFYRGVCEANLGQLDRAQAHFESFLEMQPGASLDPSMYSKTTAAAFEAARKKIAPPADADRGSPMFVAFQEFKLPANSGEPVNERWADGPVKWILTAEEARTFSQLESGAERQEFVDRFWDSRNSRPGNPDNMFRTSFERRVAFADEKFAVTEGGRGSLTDRGMVFVLLGPPTFASRKAIGAGEDPTEAEGISTEGSRDVANALKLARGDGKLSGHRAATALSGSSGTQAADAGANWREIWHYRKELLPRSVSYQQVDIEFVTKSGYGAGILQRAAPTQLTLEAAKAGHP